MRPSRPLLSLLCVVVFASSASFGRSQTTDAPRQEPVSPTAPTTERPAYPLVVRIDHTALDPLTAHEINQRGRVDMVVLGTHAVGESRSQGAISVLLIPDRDEASFDLKFSRPDAYEDGGHQRPSPDLLSHRHWFRLHATGLF